MVQLEDLKRGAIVKGILHGQAVSVLDVARTLLDPSELPDDFSVP